MKTIGNARHSEQTIARIHKSRAKEKNLFGRLEEIAKLESKLRDIKLGKSHLAIAQN